MKTITGIILSCLAASLAHGQNTLQFTSAKATVENAILLNWASNSNEIYEIDEADSLIDTNTGTTTWNSLYTDYPSQGTNTFIADAGNYDITPAIVHPKFSPMRFYRVVMTGTNTSPDNPIVSIVSPTNGASLSGDIVVNVSASSDEYLTQVLLYVDGEPQWITAGTNFEINTCEWPNGPHTLFATAEAQSSLESPSYNDSVTEGRAVSSYVNVTFSNLITRLDFSQYFFEPSEGETQAVTATFAANVNWTLEIQDINSNDVQYVTGSGSSMDYDWDGTGTNEAPIPDGVYSYVLTAQTNGLAPQAPASGGGSGSNSPPSPLLASAVSSTELYATPAGGGDAVPFILYPPGIDTNNFTFFEASPYYMTAEFQTLDAASANAAGAASPGYSGPLSQSTRGPKRKPRRGVKNSSGTYGVCYQAVPNGFFLQQPTTGNPIPSLAFTGYDGNGRSSAYIPWDSLKCATAEAWGFGQVMQSGAYKQKFSLSDGQWGPNDIISSAKGGNSIFSTCSFGLLSSHGCYGTYPEIDGIYYTYLALFDQVHGGSYVKLSDMSFGSSTAKWMTILSCNILNGNAITSMANNSILPANGNLHLLLGFNSYSYCDPYLGVWYASNLVAQATIHDSFINACKTTYQNAYQNTNNASKMIYGVQCRIMGYNSCFGDTLYLYNDPDPNSGYNIEDNVVIFH